MKRDDKTNRFPTRHRLTDCWLFESKNETFVNKVCQQLMNWFDDKIYFQKHGDFNSRMEQFFLLWYRFVDKSCQQILLQMYSITW